VGLDEPLGQAHDRGAVGRRGEHLDVARAVDELVLELQVLQQGLGERLDLLEGGLHERGDTADDRRHDVGVAADLAQGVGDAARALLGVAAVLDELAPDGLGACLGDTGLGDLGLGLGELQQDAQLLLDLGESWCQS
jgi:hypothetical protein